MLRVELCPPKFIHCGPSPQHTECDQIWKQGLYRGDKWRLLGWTLIRIAWSPSKKRTFGHRHKERDNSVKTQGEDHHL